MRNKKSSEIKNNLLPNKQKITTPIQQYINEFMINPFTPKNYKTLHSKTQSHHPSPSTLPIADLQSHLLNLWTSYSVDETYQNLFLIYIETFTDKKQQVKEIQSQIKKTYEKNSLYFLLQENMLLRTQIKHQIEQQLQNETQNPSIKKSSQKLQLVLKQLCDKLKNLRRINLLIAENILKIFQDFKVTRQSSLGSIGKKYIQFFMKIDVENEFIKQSFLNEYIMFQKGYDPFFLVHYEQIMKSANPNALKKHQPVSQLFDMNISYVYRLMRAQKKMLKYMLLIDDHKGNEKERKEIINRQRMMKLSSNSVKQKSLPQSRGSNIFLPSISKHDRNTLTQNSSAASNIKPIIALKPRKSYHMKISQEKNNIDDSQFGESVRKKIYSLRPVNKDIMHSQQRDNGKSEYIRPKNQQRNLSLNVLRNAQAYLDSQKPQNNKNFQTQDEPLIKKRPNQRYALQNESQFSVEDGKIQQKRPQGNLQSQKRWNIKQALKDRRHYLRPIKTRQTEQNEIIEEGQNENSDDPIHFQGRNSLDSDYPIRSKIRKSKLANTQNKEKFNTKLYKSNNRMQEDYEKQRKQKTKNKAIKEKKNQDYDYQPIIFRVKKASKNKKIKQSSSQQNSNKQRRKEKIRQKSRQDTKKKKSRNSSDQSQISQRDQRRKNKKKQKNSSQLQKNSQSQPESQSEVSQKRKRSLKKNSKKKEPILLSQSQTQTQKSDQSQSQRNQQQRQKMNNKNRKDKQISKSKIGQKPKQNSKRRSKQSQIQELKQKQKQKEKKKNKQNREKQFKKKKSKYSDKDQDDEDQYSKNSEGEDYKKQKSKIKAKKSDITNSKQGQKSKDRKGQLRDPTDYIKKNQYTAEKQAYLKNQQQKDPKKQNKQMSKEPQHIGDNDKNKKQAKQYSGLQKKTNENKQIKEIKNNQPKQQEKRNDIEKKVSDVVDPNKKNDVYQKNNSQPKVQNKNIDKVNQNKKADNNSSNLQSVQKDINNEINKVNKQQQKQINSEPKQNMGVDSSNNTKEGDNNNNKDNKDIVSPSSTNTAGNNNANQNNINSSTNNNQPKTTQQQQAKIKIIPGKLTFQQFSQYIKSKKIHPLYKQKLKTSLQFILKSAQKTQTYLNQFHLNDQLAIMALCSPTSLGNLVIYLWAPIENICDEKQSMFFFKKYLDYLQNQTTFKSIMYCGEEMSQLKNQLFQNQKDKNYLRKRVNPVKRQKFQFQYFFSMQATNITFVQQSIESLLYSDQITPFSQTNSWCNSSLLMGKQNSLINNFKDSWKVNQTIKSINQANQMLERDSYDTFQVGQEKIKFENINMTRCMLSQVPKYGFIANEGYMIVSGKVLSLGQANKKVCKIQLLNDICLYFGNEFKTVEEMVMTLQKNKQKAKQQDSKFAFKMFSKQLYGKYSVKDEKLENNKAYYCNWDLNFVWRDQIPGKIIHDLNSIKHKYGSQSFMLLIEMKGEIALGAEILKQDFLY